MKKRLICWSLVLLLICSLALVGCSSSQAPAPSEAPGSSQEGSAAAVSEQAAPSEEKPVLKMLGCALSRDNQIAAWDEAIAAFEAKYNVTVETTFTGDWNEVPRNLAQAQLAQDQVDIVLTTGSALRSTLAPSGAIMDITSLIGPRRDRFSDGVLEAYTVGDRIWGFPYEELTTACIFYNKPLFDELGLQEPTTLEELAEVAAVLKDKAGIANPMIQCGKTEAQWPMWFHEAYNQISGNQSMAKIEDWLSGNSSFVNAETTAAFDVIKQYEELGIITTDSLDTDYDGMTAAFVAGKCAMMYDGSWCYADLVSRAPFELGAFMMPMPANTGNIHQPCGSADYCMAVPTNCSKDNFDMIVNFIDFFTSDEFANIYQSHMQAAIPVFNAAPSVSVETLPLVDELRGFGENTLMFLDWMWPSEINETMYSNISALVAGSVTPEQVVQLIQARYEQIVDLDGYSYNWYDTWTQEQWDAVTPPAA